jgi:molecular chaperone GrpE
MSSEETQTPDPAAPSNGQGPGAEVETTASGDLAEAQRQRDEYQDLLLRTRAEFTNFQKRARAQADADRQYAVGPLALDLVAVLDNFERAADAARKAGAESIVEGLDMVHKQLLAVLAKHGVEPIAAQGQPFDPNQHEALTQQPSPSTPKGPSSPSSARATSSATGSSAPPRSSSPPGPSVTRPRRSAAGGRVRAALPPGRPGRPAPSERRVPRGEDPSRGERMPTYDYICDSCDHEFEAYESIMASPQTVCPACQEPKLRRKIGPGAAILFKGSGFYQTDYRSDSYKASAKADAPADSSSKPSESPSSPAPAKAEASKPSGPDKSP